MPPLLWSWFLSLLVLVGVLARWLFLRASTDSRVDHYYWLLAARAYREQKKLPVRIPNKYLLEDETQGYPPLFGWLLGRFSEGSLRRWASYFSIVLDLLALFSILGFLAWWKGVEAPPDSLLIAVSVYLLAPLLVIYNAQLNSRALGHLFFVLTLLAQVVASELGSPELWLVAAICAAMVFLSHKMTTQMMLFIWPFWATTLGGWSWGVPALGMIVAVLITGFDFALYQWRTHGDIVRFWFRHWRQLGSHMFNDSPLYGNPGASGKGRFHQSGWRGVVKHLRTVVAYAPMNLFLVPLLFTENIPPWLTVWFLGAYAMAMLTLFVGWLRCFGGGHYYITYAVAPGAIGWALALDYHGGAQLILFMVAVVANGVALWFAWRVVRARPYRFDEDLVHLLDIAKRLPKGHMAVFPLTAAETAAFHTPHAILWGGHSNGFRRLEGLFPVVTKPIGNILREHGVQWLLWNVHYWSDCESVLRKEGIEPSLISEIGAWKLARLSVHTVKSDLNK